MRVPWLVAAGLIVGLVIAVPAVLALNGSPVYTGCLRTQVGTFYGFQQGPQPLRECKPGDQVVSLTGGELVAEFAALAADVVQLRADVDSLLPPPPPPPPAPEAEASNNTYIGVTVTETTKGSDVFEATVTGPTTSCSNGAGAACSFFYDASDVFNVDGSAATLQGFEDALSVGDTLATLTYDGDPAGISIFTLTDFVATLTVTDPSAAKTVDANSFTIKGAADPGATVRIKVDLNDDGDALDAGEGTVASGTATVDGAYSVPVSLTQDAANNFVAHQIPSGGVEGAAVHVPTITEGANVAAKMSTSAATNGGVAGILDPGDAIVITFNEKVAGVGTGDTLSIIDVDGSSATLTCGPDVTCVVSGGDLVLTLTINSVVFASGGSPAGIQPSAQFTAVSGFLGDDGLAISVIGSGSGRVFGDGSPALDAF